MRTKVRDANSLISVTFSFIRCAFRVWCRSTLRWLKCGGRNRSRLDTKYDMYVRRRVQLANVGICLVILISFLISWTVIMDRPRREATQPLRYLEDLGGPLKCHTVAKLRHRKSHSTQESERWAGMTECSVIDVANVACIDAGKLTP